MPQNQGKLNVDTVIQGIINGDKKKDIAVKAGSNANSPQAKCNAVNRVIKTDEYKEKAKTFIERLEDETKRLISNIEQSVIDGKYSEKTQALERLAKLKELLSGGDTERIGQNIVVLPERAIKAYSTNNPEYTEKSI